MNFTTIKNKRLFGETFNNFDIISRGFLCEISKNEYSYGYLDVNYYCSNIVTKGVTWAMHIYWEEMLQRIYLAAITGFLRFYNWLDGIDYSLSTNNIILFESSVRGFIESSCDLYDALEKVSITIAENHKNIKQALNGESKLFWVSEELENTLLHFQYAGKQNLESPSYIYKPKSAKKYLSSPHLESLHLYDCYSHLCELTHPAEGSLSIFLKNTNNVFNIKIDTSEQIDNFIDTYSENLSALFERTVNTIIILFKTVNQFGIDKLSLRYADNINCDLIKAWRRISAAFNK